MIVDNHPPAGIRNHPIVGLIKDAVQRGGFKSVGAFAAATGIARATVYNLIADRAPIQPSLETLFKLEVALETPVGQLVELFRPTDDNALEQNRVAALEGLRGKYAGPNSLSAELHAERRAERA